MEILWTRGLEPVYDPATLLRGLGVFKEGGREFRCTVAAGGVLEGRLRALARDLGIESRVRFLGGYEPGDLPEMLLDADVYVTCAVSDGASLSLLEGMAGGLFPVAADIPANREWITPGHNGLLFKPGDAHALADALESACRQRSRWREVALGNQKIVLARGDRDRNLGELENVYRRLVRSR